MNNYNDPLDSRCEHYKTIEKEKDQRIFDLENIIKDLYLIAIPISGTLQNNGNIKVDHNYTQKEWDKIVSITKQVNKLIPGLET